MIGWEAPGNSLADAGWLSSVAHDLRAERLQLAGEVLVPAVDELDTAHLGGPFGGQGGDQVGERAAQVGHLDVRGAQPGRTGDHCGVDEVAPRAPALQTAQALRVDT